MHNEAWVIVYEAIALVIVIAVEHAVLSLEEGIDRPGPTVRSLEGRDVIMVHEQSKVSLALGLVDEAVPDLEGVQPTAGVEDSIED